MIAPSGTNVTIDGKDVAGFDPIGQSGFAVAHVQLENTGDGTHKATADASFGISVYGVQEHGSYWYPGGADLKYIPQ